MQYTKSGWRAFKDVAIVFSFVVNFLLIIVLLFATVPGLNMALQLKTDLVEPLLASLDAAFVGLGEADIDTQIDINESVDIMFDLPLDEPMPISFYLPIEQDIDVVLTENVPLMNMPATFTLPGGGGMINGSVSLALPTGLILPIHLGMVVPVSETIDVKMNVAVSETVPICMNVPVHIELGEAGLAPAVEDLREVFRPLSVQIERLPDGIGVK